MKKKVYRSILNDGFAIPQILLLGVGVAVALSGILYTSILSLSGTRLNRQELLSKSASESGISNLRNLLNDSGDSYFHYFWLSDSCSASAKSCPSGLTKGLITLPDPPLEYWSDELWCEGSINCSGRQKAPMCSVATSASDPKPLDWGGFRSIFRQLIDSSKDKIGEDLDKAKRDFIQYFEIKSSEYTGTEKYGVSSVVVEGITQNNSNDVLTGFNKLRANIQINNDTPYRGFGFLSAGENQLDGDKNLYLGNLNISSEIDNPKGSIIWRRNIVDENECAEIIEKAKAENASLPLSGDGGIWVQPIGLPKQPRLKNIHDVEGVLICTPISIKRVGSNCKLPNSSGSSNYRITSIYASSPNSRFEVTTSNSKPITLEIMGDIDISNNGTFCHLEEGSNICGSGKPENLTILFKQETKTIGNKIYCNNDEGSKGGVKLVDKKIINISSSNFDNNNLPGSSIFVDNTGFGFNAKFGGLIFGPKTTFISTIAESPWVQSLENDLSKENIRAPLIVSHRGTYGWILDTSGGRNGRWHDKMTNIILNSDGYLIPFLNYIDNGKKLEIIGIGYDSKYQNFSSAEPKTGKILIYDVKDKSYFLRSFQVYDNLNRSNKRSSLGFFPWAAAKMNNDSVYLGSASDINEGDSKIILDQYRIKLEARADSKTKNFHGAAWMKTLCFDNLSNQSWEFNNKFIEGVISRYGKEFNYGVKFYRGRSITLWDTLRDFES